MRGSLLLGAMMVSASAGGRDAAIYVTLRLSIGRLMLMAMRYELLVSPSSGRRSYRDGETRC